MTGADPATGAVARGDEAGPGADGVRARPDVGRAAVSVSLVNTVSRLTGFVRVVATGAALEIGPLGDTYQNANVVSNVLFELLAGGLLFAVLVPAFVARVTDRDVDGARRLAGVLVGRAVVGLGAVVAVVALASPLVARGLLVAADPATRDQQVALATVLLWFVLPQVVLYAVGSVLTALLQAAHRFVAASAAPIANNAVVTVTMVAFAAVHGTGGGLRLDTVDKLVLGGGTLLGTVAMTAIVVGAAARAGLAVRPRWRDPAVGPLGDLARQGAWGAGHIGLNQVMVLSTAVIAAGVGGGAIAYTFAFVFFLLPHAVIAHPLVTTLTPGLAAHAHRGDDTAFAADVGRGLRVLLVLLLPSAALLGVLGWPALHVVAGVGGLDSRGLGLVAATLAAYATGLAGYSTFFLLTRAAYAVGDAQGPTLVNLVVTGTAVAGMAVAALAVDGTGRLVCLGLVHGVAVTGGAVALGLRLQRRTRPVPGVAGALARGLAAAAAGGLVAALASRVVGWDGRVSAVVALALGAALGGAAALAVLAAARAPELRAVVARLPGRAPRGGAR
ncbi:MAG TPA: lipid II flippase MurJ [Acidimicrobiales bacterium]|nr:lipid II flippase MurJ [Acidimicrobiales bacterium]